MRMIEHYSEPWKTMKKSTLKIAIFGQNFDTFVMRVGKFFHCEKAERQERESRPIILGFQGPVLLLPAFVAIKDCF